MKVDFDESGFDEFVFYRSGCSGCSGLFKVFRFV